MTQDAGELGRARLLLDAGRAEGALPLLDQWLAAHPDDPEGLRLMTLAQYKLGRYAQAVDVGRRAVAVAPRSPDAHYIFGAALWQHGDLTPAAAEADAAIRLAPRWAEAYVVATNVAVDRGRLAEAHTFADTAMSLDPQSTTVLSAKGRVELRGGHPDAARRYFSEVLALDPQNAVALNNLGVTSLKRRRLTESMHWYARALATDPRFTLARINLDRVVDALFWRLVVVLLPITAAAAPVLLSIWYVPLGVAVVGSWWFVRPVVAAGPVLRSYLLDYLRRTVRWQVVLAVSLACSVWALLVVVLFEAGAEVTGTAAPMMLPAFVRAAYRSQFKRAQQEQVSVTSRG